ncbi:class IIb bacteriocin, lactobin A/cerein 7B family [Veronia nyctiphanis]|nr:class IIb bacteriocin, lactobin A/cerein 7B family [Veronia nyctiphanis]
MKTLNTKEISNVNGGVPPMLVVWGVYTVLAPAFAYGVAKGASGN